MSHYLKRFVFFLDGHDVQISLSIAPPVDKTKLSGPTGPHGTPGPRGEFICYEPCDDSKCQCHRFMTEECKHLKAMKIIYPKDWQKIVSLARQALGLVLDEFPKEDLL